MQFEKKIEKLKKIVNLNLQKKKQNENIYDITF